MTAKVPRALESTVAAWQAGHMTSTEQARHLGITRAAAQSRMARARKAGLIGPYVSPVDRAMPAPIGRLGRITVSAFAAGGWRYLDQAVQVTNCGRPVGEYRPIGAGPRVADPIGDPYVPEALELELARLAMETARALAEIEELGDQLHPGQRLVLSRRAHEFARRRRHYFDLKHGQRKEIE